MPVRSSSSPVLRWPDDREVRKAAETWARHEAERRPDVVRLGYFGSYANGTWGVGSDLDLIAVVRNATEPFERRAISWNLDPLPVPAELLVYGEDEWVRMMREGGRFAATLRRETVWLVERGASA